RAWLRATLAQITTAEEKRPAPKTALQVAFTHEGLEKMAVLSHVREGFSAEFRCGIAGDSSRSRRLGDTGANSPEWWEWGTTGKVSRNRDQLTYGNTVSLGEFLLGYSNEYGRFTDRPLLSPQDPGSEELLEATDRPGKKDLGLNGTYVVMRQLRQDVRGFWQFLDKAAGGNRENRYKLAEAFVGRALSDGAPLVPLSPVPIP